MKVSQEILEAKTELHELMTARGFWFFCYDADAESVSVYDVHTKDAECTEDDANALERIITTLLDAPNSGAPWRMSNYVCWQKGNVMLEDDNFSIHGIASRWDDASESCQLEDEASDYDILW